MTTSSPSKIARPLSPHLQVYKPQLTSGMSIFHRITGVGLSAALPVFVAWLVVAASGPRVYADFTNLFHNPIGRIVLLGWNFCFFYHLFCGVRHLVWDAGKWLSLKAVYVSGYVAVALSLALTLATALKVFGFIP